MRFRDDPEFRAKIFTLAERAEALHISCSKINDSFFLVKENGRRYRVFLALHTKINEISVACECAVHRNSGLCIHVGYALKRCYSADADRFEIPEFEKTIKKLVDPGAKECEGVEELLAGESCTGGEEKCLRKS